MKEIRYYAPDNIQEALGILKSSGQEITVLAGGSDVVPMMNSKGFRPGALMYIGKLGLSYIEPRDRYLAIGAAATWKQIVESAAVAQICPALAQAARTTNAHGIKTTATIGGNLQTASPAADLPPPLLVMDARVCLRSSEGRRFVDLNEFYLGIGKTVRRPDEILEEVQVPHCSGNSVFMRIGRRKATTPSILSTAVRMAKTGDTCSEIRIAIGCAAPTPIRCHEAEQFMTGKETSPDMIRSCAEIAVGAMRPRSRGRTSAWYRKKAGHALISRALACAAGIDGPLR